MKICNKCKEEKPLEEFYKDKHRVKQPCKTCRLKYQRVYDEERARKQKEFDANFKPTKFPKKRNLK